MFEWSGKNEHLNEKNWESEFDLCIFHIKIRLYRNFHENLWQKNFDPFFRTFLTSQTKTENKGEKAWEHKINFWILHIKIRLCGSFLENLRKQFLTHFLRHFWLIEEKMEMMMKKYHKMFSIFTLHIKIRF